MRRLYPRRGGIASIVDELLPTVLLFFFLATFAFASIDWHFRRRRLGTRVGPSWDCPHCGVNNEAEGSVCWSCGAAVSMNRYFPEMGPSSAETWRCRHCGAWNGTSRHTCWSCSSAPAKQTKRQA